MSTTASSSIVDSCCGTAGLAGSWCPGCSPISRAPRPTTPEASLRDYLAWIADTSDADALEAWQAHLDGYTEPALVAPRAVGSTPRAPRRIGSISVSPRRVTPRRREKRWRHTQHRHLGSVVPHAVSRPRVTDVAFGSTVAGRPTEVPGLDTVIGLFLNTVPVRTVLHPQESVRDFLRRGQDARVALMAYDHIGLARLQQKTEASGAVRRPLRVAELPHRRRGARAVGATRCHWRGVSTTPTTRWRSS